MKKQICKNCKKEKPLSGFADSVYKDGKQGVCKACQTKARLALYRKEKEEKEFEKLYLPI